MDCFRIVHLTMQIVLEVDFSAGHEKQREDGLYMSEVRVIWGSVKVHLA